MPTVALHNGEVTSQSAQAKQKGERKSVEIYKVFFYGKVFINIRCDLFSSRTFVIGLDSAVNVESEVMAKSLKACTSNISPRELLLTSSSPMERSPLLKFANVPARVVGLCVGRCVGLTVGSSVGAFVGLIVGSQASAAHEICLLNPHPLSQHAPLVSSVVVQRRIPSLSQ